MSRPNIFRIATSELSQDAFFVWLMQWADPSAYEKSYFMGSIGQDLVRYFIGKKYNECPDDIVKVEVKRQWKNIDICVKVNDEFFIAIEDKTGTGVHSGQLDRYKKIVEDYCASESMKPVLIYLKTQDESKSRMSYAQQKGYAIVNRKDLMRFFYDHPFNHDVYMDFIDNLCNMSEASSAFRRLPVKNWNMDSWRGFYSYLDEVIPVKDWCYVANPSGGFLGLWWHYTAWKDYNVYLQIEKGKDEGKLCFKINQVTENHYNVRREWAKILWDHAKETDFNEIKFTKFHKGNNMTVAFIEQQVWLAPDDSIIDLEQVVTRLHKYERFLDECAENQ